MDADETSSEDERSWILFYEDAEMEQILFSGYGAEQAARKAYERALTNWSCHLFVSPALPLLDALEQARKELEFVKCERQVTAQLRTGVDAAQQSAKEANEAVAFQNKVIVAGTLKLNEARQSAKDARALLEAFDLGYAWRGTLVGQTLEDSRAVGRTLCGDLFSDLPVNVNAVPSFDTADAGIVAAKAEIKRALAAALRARIEAFLEPKA